MFVESIRKPRFETKFTVVHSREMKYSYYNMSQTIKSKRCIIDNLPMYII